ncbi:glycoside hydrolase family 2 protein [Cohnella algarum]|uniref:glycoside hydrolase family 2 protein n=1 Tax=Cohnella algarum TaxID=2044859 RepID=UPI003B82F30E
MELKHDWRIQHFEPGEKRPLDVASPGLDDRFWATASVPGDVHAALIERRIIDHPYYGHNDVKGRWIEQKEWWYRKSFDFAKDDDPELRHELAFEGLDTFATVYLNGLEIGTADNMLMGHTFDVTRALRDGRNTLAVKFDPLSLHNRDKLQFDWSSYTKERPWIRKAAMNFGWDWGPRLVTVGIWGKVRLESRRLAKLESVFARTVRAGAKEATVRVDVEARAFRRNEPCECEIRLLAGDGSEVASKRVPVSLGKASADLAVDSPRLWWTHDLGEPYLYELEATLYARGEKTDVYRKPFGIRTVELRLRNEAGENAFAFALNGVKLFAKGTNWIPADNLIGSIPDDRYRDLIALAVDGNMNMLRVWAGAFTRRIFSTTNATAGGFSSGRTSRSPTRCSRTSTGTSWTTCAARSSTTSKDCAITRRSRSGAAITKSTGCTTRNRRKAALRRLSTAKASITS